MVLDKLTERIGYGLRWSVANVKAGNARMKQSLLDAAEVVDAWRVFPRFYMGMFAYFLWDLHVWYQPLASNPDYYANLVFGVVGVVTGLYMNTGRRWGG